MTLNLHQVPKKVSEKILSFIRNYKKYNLSIIRKENVSKNNKVKFSQQILTENSPGKFSPKIAFSNSHRNFPQLVANSHGKFPWKIATANICKGVSKMLLFNFLYQLMP